MSGGDKRLLRIIRSTFAISASSVPLCLDPDRFWARRYLNTKAQRDDTEVAEISQDFVPGRSSRLPIWRL